ncbi:MAG: nuclear transport factor 2 family protein, partial [Myxococcota bacterium]
MIDREALRQLMVDYFCGVDAHDFERVGACFTPDVRANYGQLYQGREALIEFIRGVRFFDTTLHCMGGQLFELAGDEARMLT